LKTCKNFDSPPLQFDRKEPPSVIAGEYKSVADLPRNFSLLDSVEEHAKRGASAAANERATAADGGQGQKGPGAVSCCPLCEEPRPVVFLCLDCDQPMCATCKTAHSRSKKTQNDNVVALSDVSDLPQHAAATQNRFCAVHKKPLELFDKQCQVPVCSFCVLLDGAKHKGHECDAISAAAVHMRVDLTAMSRGARGFAEELRAAEAAVAAVEAELGRAHEREQAALRTTFVQVCACVKFGGGGLLNIKNSDRDRERLRGTERDIKRQRETEREKDGQR
jgi:hypothetical protein